MVHEVIGPADAPKLGDISTVIIVNATSTNREHSRIRWVRDEKLLTEELAKDPHGDTRSAFYLAQTLELNKKYEEAYQMNLLRDSMGGWDQERYVALLRAGRTALLSGRSFLEAKECWLRGFQRKSIHCLCNCIFVSRIFVQIIIILTMELEKIRLELWLFVTILAPLYILFQESS